MKNKEKNINRIYDATTCPWDIAYPTDVGWLNRSREFTEVIIDRLPAPNSRGVSCVHFLKSSVYINFQTPSSLRSFPITTLSIFSSNIALAFAGK
ncbi:hypothetical protein [Algoriphagus resistens]|uniref:hypothetical protein n=1 Tax=Algoriphagus resistens TaxID=1750590 RepID=UPI0009E8E381|nr:hypothetical protein [Algoriphagus resistens]